MAHCLVTGGAGFIGSHLVDGLLRAGHEVRVIDNLSTGSSQNINAVRDGLKVDGLSGSLDIVTGSILEPDALETAMAGIDYVFHQAALPSVAFSLEDPLLSQQVNVEGTLRILIAARDAGVKRVMYAGSSSAYGDSPTLPKHEGQPVNPLSPYAIAKLAGEQYCQVFTRIYGLETVVLRYFNVFGARQNPASQYAAVIPAFITALLNDKALHVFGDGHQSRDFTHVANVVHGNILAMTAPKASGRVINLALGGRVSLLELIQYLEELTEKRAEVKFLPTRSGDVQHSQAAVELAKDLLGFETQVDIHQGLALALDFYRQHGDC